MTSFTVGCSNIFFTCQFFWAILITIGIPTSPGNPSDPSPVFGGDQNTKPINIKVDGNNTPEEILLDGLGNENPKEKAPVYIHYNFDDDQNFSLLGLPKDKQ